MGLLAESAIGYLSALEFGAHLTPLLGLILRPLRSLTSSSGRPTVASACQDPLFKSAIAPSRRSLKQICGRSLPLIDPTWLTCQSLGVPILNSSRHERFAQLVASGKYSDMEAFRQAGYSASSAQQNAHRLSENEGVKARTEELRARNSEKCQLSSPGPRRPR